MAGLPPTRGLLYELAAILSALIFGVFAVRLKLVKPERGDMAAMGLVTGRVALPLLIFKTVATARLRGLDLGVALACTLAKGLMMVIVWGTTYFARRPKTSTQDRFLTATIFSSVVVLTNDFALGFPVIQALYGQEMTAYIALNAVVMSMLFTPLVSVLLAVGHSLPDGSGSEGKDVDGAEPPQKHGDVRSSTGRRCADVIWLLRVIGGALMNNILGSAALGLLYKLAFSFTLVDDGHTLGLPPLLDRVLGLFTAPFGMCSLFTTGTNVRSVKISAWPLFLVVSKVVVVAFLSFQLSTMVVPRGATYTNSTNFSFFYGTLPTAAGPIILGSKFVPGSAELVATSILMAVFLSGIVMYMFAVISMTPSNVSLSPELAELQRYFSILSVASITILVAGVLVLTLKGSWGWSREGKQMLAALGVSIAAYQSAMLVFDELVKGTAGALCLHGRPLLIIIAFFQNCSRLLVLGLPVLIMKWGPRHLGAADTAGRTGLVLITLALAGSGVLCRLVHPSAILEVCGAAAEAEGLDAGKITAEVKIWPINLLDHLLFWTMLVLLIANAFHFRGRWGGQRPSEGEGAEAAEKVVESGIGDADEDSQAEQTDALKQWLETPPRSLFKILMLAQLLRTLQQVINSSQVLTEAMISGGFVTMLILEYFLEHGQGFIFLVGFALDTKFINAIAQAITSTLPLLARALPSTYLFGASQEFCPKHQETVAMAMSACASERTPSLRPSLSRRSTLEIRAVRTIAERVSLEDNVSPTGAGIGANLHRE